MARSSKKRHASPSPNRSDSTKKARQASTTASVRSHRDSSGPQLSRAKSVFRGQRDPYFPLNKKRSSSLLTDEDYFFRVQVISTTNDFTTDVFKKAVVQGLVKICFPQGVLEDLGVEIVAQHMRDEEAPEDNIIRTTAIFRSEMFHRVTWMLAEYLDTPGKVEASMKAIMAASASLHGTKVGEDVLGNVIGSLHKLRERLPDSSTEKLQDSIDMETLTFRSLDCTKTPSGDEDFNVIEEPVITSTGKHVPGNKKSQTSSKSSKKRSKGNGQATNEATTVPLEPHYLREDSTAGQAQSHGTFWRMREGKEGRISTSWRWDVEEGAKLQEITSRFKRTSDLFAYHALPTVQRRMGPQTKRKELRQEMETMLVNMPQEEFEQWGQSFQKLTNGDTTVLIRSTSDPMSGRQMIVPAPGFAGCNLANNRLTDGIHTSASGSTQIKHEVGVGEEFERLSRHSHTDTAVTAPERSNGILPTGYPQRVTGPSSPSTETYVRYRTPIMDLLWGPADFGIEARANVVHTIMDSMNQRVTAQSVGVQLLDGTTKIITKATLKVRLLARVTPHASQNNPSKVREGMEDKLVPWVVANPSLFPELLSEPLIFVNMLPYFNAVLDLLSDPNMSMSRDNVVMVKTRMFDTLAERDISKFLRSGPKNTIIQTQINGILGESKHSDVLKRSYLEHILRYVAFEHKDKFPELKATVLVRTWERETRQVW